MKLQAKFTIIYISIVLVTILVSFCLIQARFENQFDSFIHVKNQQWQKRFMENKIVVMTDDGEVTLPLQSPFSASRPGMSETPEQIFLRTVRESLLWAGVIDISIAIVLAYFVSSFLLRRIYGLKSSMEQYMKDGSSKPVIHEGKDEVDELAHMYNGLIEKIEKQEKIRKDFFIDMSHELRTPLTSVKGYLEGMVDNVFDPDKEREIKEKTLKETDRMIYLVKEMTVLSKLESGQIQLEKKEVDLSEMTAEVVEMLNKDIGRKSLDVVVSGDLHAVVDPMKFKQVLINLIDNAVNYSKNNSAVRIEMQQNDDYSTWRISNVYDEQEADVESFFERFQRGDKSRMYDGSKAHLGIGLSIVKKIVEQHGASISVHTHGGEIFFEIRFPK